MQRKSHTTRVDIDGRPNPRGAFELSYIACKEDLLGSMQPRFKPHWWAQYLGDGTSEWFVRKREALAWLKDWEGMWNGRNYGG